MDYDISVVLGSKNRKNLLKATIIVYAKMAFMVILKLLLLMGDQQMELVVG